MNTGFNGILASYDTKGAKSIALVVAALLAVALTALCVTCPQAFAGDSAEDASLAADLPVSGTFGSCAWSIDADGTLIVAPSDGIEGALPDWGTHGGLPWAVYCNQITSALVKSTVHAPSCYGLLSGCRNLECADLSGLDTSSTRYTSSMFEGCMSLTTLDLSTLNFSNVTEANDMFNACYSLTTLDLPGSGAPSLLQAREMFENCKSLATIDLTGFDMSSAALPFNMFAGCIRLERIYASDSFDLSRYAGSSGMFAGCSSLVGGNGTEYDEGEDGCEYARIDRAGAPGYLTQGPSVPEGEVDAKGADRYETSAAIARKAYPNGSTSVVVATGEGFPDALAASGYAGTRNCPVLLTAGGTLSRQTKLAILGLGATQITIMGGTSAVSSTVEDQLRELGSVTRVSGSDRFRTCCAIYDACSSWGRTAVVATGSNYPDALSVSSYAFANGYPIFLTSSERGLSAECKSRLAAGGFECIIITGGEKAVLPADEAWLAANVAPVTRLAGDDRYETSKLIARYMLSAGGSADGPCITTGRNYPDALSCSALAGGMRSVMLLADEGRLGSFDVLRENASRIGKVYIIGGTSAVPESVRFAALEAAGLL